MTAKPDLKDWEPTVLSPFRYQARIDVGEEGVILVTADCGNTILDANNGKIYLLPDEARALISLLEQSLVLTGRYDEGEMDMIEGLSWREWRSQALGRTRAGSSISPNGGK
jgi:hypothetical protein